VGATVLTMATATTTGTIALADQLRFLRERVPISERDVIAATGADEATVAAWLSRRAAPAGEQAARLSELIAACERLEVSTKPEGIARWLNQSVPMLDGRTPLATIASGGYEQVARIAEDLIDLPFT
jgi:DNA-binding transcriptional regulator YiaG